MKLGARAYLLKPFDHEELLIHLQQIEEIIHWREAADATGRGNLVGSSSVMRQVYADIDIAATSDAPLLISGDTGTGKELAARAVHALSARRNNSFVAVNLGAIPKELAEDELFGHVKGAYTGAHQDKKGRFTLSEGGTLFLDEIDSLPLSVQPKLLRAIETREIWPVGAEKPITVDARIIAASNTDLHLLIEQGAFREDVYYRLNVLNIAMPPLRDHPEDIPQMTHALLERINRDSASACSVSAEALAHLMSHPWDGNVRELSNTLERAIARAASSHPSDNPIMRIDVSHFDSMPTPMKGLSFKQAKSIAMEEWSKVTIRQMLVQTNGNVSEAARQFKMSRTALIRIMNRYGIK